MTPGDTDWAPRSAERSALRQLRKPARSTWPWRPRKPTPVRAEGDKEPDAREGGPSRVP